MWLLLGCLACCAVTFFLFQLGTRTASANLQAPEILIVAAHSDDCVIMGAELAWGIIRDGGEVKIAYMTCSGPEPTSQISKERTEEARAAWKLLHNDNITIANCELPQSEVAGPAAYSEDNLSRYSDLISDILSKLQPNSIVLVPAPNESHVDHNNARAAALRAVGSAKRVDLRIFETAEYNSILSMRHDPWEVVLRVLDELPFINRMLPKRFASPAFFGGPPGSMFKDTPERLDMKLLMLDAFPSQDPELLRQFFSWQSKYRPLWNGTQKLQFQLLDRTADISVVVYIALLIVTVGVISTVAMGGSPILGLIATIFGVLTILFAIRKKRLVLGLMGSAIVLGAIVGISI